MIPPDEDLMTNENWKGPSSTTMAKLKAVSKRHEERIQKQRDKTKTQPSDIPAIPTLFYPSF